MSDCSTRCRPVPTNAARTANSIPSCRPGRCWRGKFQSASEKRSSATGLHMPICCRLEHDPEKWVPGFGKDHAPVLSPQYAAGFLADLGNNALAERVDFRIGHGLVARLYSHRDGNRLLVRADAGAFVDVEYAHIDDELFVDALRRAHNVGGFHRVIDHKGEIALDRLERRQLK